ncbi:MAG: hypothetical protein AAF959_19975 [Cyanobacteria bacterium P01_D01_bin.56]
MHKLKQVRSAGTDINHELLKIWIARYLPELGSISSHVRKHVEQRLRSSISDEARLTTSQTISHHLASDCLLATTDTKRLLSTTGAFANDGWELQELSAKIEEIYRVLIDGYERSFIFSPVVDYIHVLELDEGKLEAAALVIPHFESLMLTVGPLIRELKAIYFSSINRHLIGFMTTQIHLTRKHILGHLTPYDSTWLAPYLQVLDELICMPWQRICSVAASETDMTASVALVRKMMPRISSISAFTYQQAVRTFPHHISCQGRLQSLTVQNSSLRDLNMFQAYIWLCILEDSPSVIEKQLLPLCLQVFSLTKIQWPLACFGVQTILEIIRQQLTAQEQVLFNKHADTIEQLFLDAGNKPDQVALLKQQLQKSNPVNSVSYTWKPN